MLVFPQWIQQTFSLENLTQGGPRHSKWKQQKPWEEEVPIQATAALKISRKHPQQHQPYDLPTWGQIKTLTNQIKNLISQQGMPQSPETLSLCSIGLRHPPPSGHKMDGEKTQVSTNDSTHMPPP